MNPRKRKEPRTVLRLDEREWALLRRAVDKRGDSIGEFIRGAVVRAARRALKN